MMLFILVGTWVVVSIILAFVGIPGDIAWIIGLIAPLALPFICTKLSDAGVFKDEGREAFEHATLERMHKWSEESLVNDFYYKPSPNRLGLPNYDFYNDGSLKHDPATGKTYSKGQYYCRCDGVMADRGIAPDVIPRPPKK